MQETCVWSLHWEAPLRRTYKPTPVFYLENPTGQKVLGSCSPRGCKESDTTEVAMQQQHTPSHITAECHGTRVPSVPGAGQQTLVWFPCPWPDESPEAFGEICLFHLGMWWDHMLNILTFITFRFSMDLFILATPVSSSSEKSLLYHALMSSLLLSVFSLWNSSSRTLPPEVINSVTYLFLHIFLISLLIFFVWEFFIF